jgi:glycosyltransferase involved in cell wall biosynthesis
MISICVITYNQEKYILKTLESIQNQVFNVDFEVIISNDKSTDNTHQVIKNFIDNSAIKDKIQYYNLETNLGVMKNLDFVFNKAKGKYIALCEGDDYWTDENKLKSQFEFMEANSEYSCVFHDSIIVDENNNYISDFNTFKPKNPIAAKDIISKGGNLAFTASMFFKNYRDYPEFIFNANSGDRALRLFLMTKGKFHFIDTKMCAYRKHSNGITQGGTISVRTKFVKSNIELLTKFDDFSNHKYNSVLKSEISNQYKYLSIFDNGIKNKWNYFLKLNFKDKIKRIAKLILNFK